jgi:hypothetical protein
MTRWTERQVEAAAKALREVSVVIAPGSWDAINEHLREHYREKVRVVLAAVESCDNGELELRP